jgi:hypothetical protein
MKISIQSTLGLGGFIFQLLVRDVLSFSNPILDSDDGRFLPLKAARAHSDIIRRANTIRLSNTANLLYINGIENLHIVTKKMN